MYKRQAFQDGIFIPLPVPPEVEENLAQPIKTALGIPSLEIFFLTTRNPLTDSDPWDGHADFFAFVPRKASAVHAASRVFWETYREFGLPAIHNPFFTPLNYYSRSYIVATIVPTWRDPAKNARSRELFGRIVDRCAEHGWGSYRTSPAFQERVVSKYSFNHNALLKFQEKLKDGIDPNGILSPGRYGIWPANTRRSRA